VLCNIAIKRDDYPVFFPGNVKLREPVHGTISTLLVKWKNYFQDYSCIKNEPPYIVINLLRLKGEIIEREKRSMTYIGILYLVVLLKEADF
jgi:hypothetical protein